MIRIHFSNSLAPLSDKEEFLLSEYVSWLILNVGPRDSGWYWTRCDMTGKVKDFCIKDPADATAFKLRHGI